MHKQWWGSRSRLGHFGQKNEKRLLHEKYESSYKIKTNYVIL